MGSEFFFQCAPSCPSGRTTPFPAMVGDRSRLRNGFRHPPVAQLCKISPYTRYPNRSPSHFQSLVLLEYSFLKNTCRVCPIGWERGGGCTYRTRKNACFASFRISFASDLWSFRFEGNQAKNPLFSLTTETIFASISLLSFRNWKRHTLEHLSLEHVGERWLKYSNAINESKKSLSLFKYCDGAPKFHSEQHSYWQQDRNKNTVKDHNPPVPLVRLSFTCHTERRNT